MKIRVLSQHDMRAYTPNPELNEVCISIRCHGEEPFRECLAFQPPPLGFQDVFRVQFDDVVCKWPPNRDDLIDLTPDQAKDIADFVVKHRSADVLVVQCFAGISRSRSTAVAIATTLTLAGNHVETEFEPYAVNTGVYNLVSSALDLALNPTETAPCE